MSLLIRYTHIPFYFCFYFAFPTSLIHHYAPPLWRDRTRSRSCSILSVSNVPPPAVQPIMKSRTTWSGTFYSFAICSHSCLPLIFNLPVFTFRYRTLLLKPQPFAYMSLPQNWDFALTLCTYFALFCAISHCIALPQSHCLYLPQYTWRQSLTHRSHPLRAP